MNEPWHDTSALGGLDRVESALDKIDRESLKNGYAMQKAWPDFFAMVKTLLNANKQLKAARTAAPCKIWGWEGGAHCVVHHHTWVGEPMSGDCERRAAPTEGDEG